MKTKWLWIVLLSLVLAACAKPTPAGPAELRVMTHDSFALSESLVTAFEQENNVKIVFVKGGDTGSALNQAILTRDSPQADVLYGVDNTFLMRALDADIFEPYNSPLLAKIPAQFQLDSQNRALPVDYGDVCINYDRAYFENNQLALPASLQDLTQPQYKGLLVVTNPAISSPGLAFLALTVETFGDGYLDYWKALKDNGLVVVNDWETAYYTNFSGSSGQGPQPMVLSYASSPAAEVIFASQPLDESPTASIVAPGTCFRQVEFVGILKGSSQRALAEKFVDWMLSVPFQEDMPGQMFVYPVNSDASLPEAFIQHAQAPVEPVIGDASLIGTRRDAWIDAWTKTVLR